MVGESVRMASRLKHAAAAPQVNTLVYQAFVCEIAKEGFMPQASSASAHALGSLLAVAFAICVSPTPGSPPTHESAGDGQQPANEREARRDSSDFREVRCACPLRFHRTPPSAVPSRLALSAD